MYQLKEIVHYAVRYDARYLAYALRELGAMFVMKKKCLYGELLCASCLYVLSLLNLVSCYRYINKARLICLSWMA